MQVVIHAGAHMTDEDRLIACLRDNTATLAPRRTHVPDPESYRRLLRDVMHTAQKTALPEDARDNVLAATGTPEDTERLVLDNHGFFGTPKMSIGGARFYPAADMRLGLLDRIFEPDGIELFFGLRNPATLLPALLPDTPFSTVTELLRGDDPAHLRWSEAIARIRAALPDIPVTVWCNEDTPLIWAQVLHAMAGTDESVPLAGEFALLPEIMTRAGHQRFTAYMDSRPGLTDAQKRRVVTAFLDKFADDDAIEEELDVPEWDPGMIETLSALYDEDVAEIARMDGVRMIMP
ncbi:hypothetical protein C6W92_14945 [Roseovarius sp. A46]|uniref:hypothetical protein n=1 Tax=Roseovarius sp. A46 TaxID=2109331 RepID=UPI001010E81F|nr:hypothetical protein [Roseovarius sp. A46]RXV59645.1 hypothetical protein C6W92_14945 [Roseovarius sp. A46]